MNFTGNYHFQEKIEKIWDYLNNPEILKNCIDGCQEFIEKEKNTFFLRIKVKIGPINTTFTGTLSLKDINPPKSYIIEANGSAGQLGGAKGRVDIKLAENNNSTILTYEAKTSINGKIAQLGSRLIEGAVKKNTNIFFKNFDSLFNNEQASNINALKESNNEKKVNIAKYLQKRNIFIFLILFFLTLFVLINNE